MKRIATVLILTITLILTMMPIQACAADDLGKYSWTGTWATDWGNMTLEQDGNVVTGVYEHDEGRITGTVSGNVLTGTWSESPSYEAPGDAGDVILTMTDDGKGFDGVWEYGFEGDKSDTSGWSEWDGGTRMTALTPIAEPAATTYTSSSWASTDLQKASDMGLIPDVLQTADMTKPISRLEFAAVCVKVYESLAATKAIPAVTNPFTDTSDVEVLKAYNTGITSGIAADKFGPNVLLNREQAATMLTRVFKRVTIPGWTLDTDSKYTLNYTMPAKFADDAKISAFAKPSVYFMVSNGIISGVGNNVFAPAAVTSSEKANNYASATREQALVIAVRMAENLKGKTADYTAN